MYRNSEIFLTTFNRIEKELKSLVKKEVGFTKSVKILRSTNATIKRYADDLLEYAELRNAIVHNKVDTAYAIAEPHDSVISAIETIEKELIDPRKVTPLFTRKVRTFQMDDTLSELLFVIYEKGFTKFPIYEGKHFRGLVTPKGITNWLADYMGQALPSPSEVLLKDILACGERDNFQFIRSDTSVYRAEEIFKEQVGKGNRIEALLITEKGTTKDQLAGIITNWDIMKV